MKVVTILGTRPEIIRLSAVLKRLDKHLDHIIVHTGQNYDYELNEVFFDDLGVRKPDHFMNVDTSSLGKVYGNILIKAEEILKAENPDAVLILGDTNSSIAGIIAKRLHIPIFHMEAGNRSFDQNVPEETNRRIIDHTADFNLCYTEHARRHLISEGLPHRRIYVTGSPMREVLMDNIEKIKGSNAVQELGLEKGKYFLASIHREENVDRRKSLGQILDAFERLIDEFDVPVIVSTHPRTKKRLESLERNGLDQRIRFMKPFGFIDYVNLQMKARCVISDSGTICEEASILNFPAITPRNAIERPEAVDTGSVVVTGLEADTIVEAIRIQTSDDISSNSVELPRDYQILNTSERVLKLIAGKAKLNCIWENLKKNDLS
ncbi:UDP-2,3-diacetamido-2,3-dideoxy-D-glucuronate 2-epimerase [Sedimentisphaera cyanobacteriorum]|uniref:UDP-2,3-diacetamido-2,3-dideoxy-D-glucuronate 2-epimerase n=1 Tax=Sedimentisphaera cyanobacteriorum TaxID=1940790 RepID=A0A1Q2HNX0_9BACT|nr:UDP-N-acetylglucosamine 2-epimerase (non-hydrolyzing) [Sedimentisphaera cyanobacteriorum]AQQ09152.1 UDP-2,3-diacetamido-2,3-dideoxy-D-glucuronate 2-epimerase [Sedimentisphaera cyanobacteriorum]